MAKGKHVRSRKVNEALRVAVIATAATMAVAFAAVMGFGAYVSGRDTIYPNITVAGIDVGGMTYDQAYSTLMTAGVGVPSGVQATAVLTDTVSVSVTSDQAGLTAPISEAVDKAYALGRDGGFFRKMGSFINCLTTPHEVYTERVLNESGVRAVISQAAQRVNRDAVEAKCEVTATEIFITRGVRSYTVDEEGVFNFIRDTLMSGQSRTTDEFSDAKSGGEEPAEPDLRKLYDELYTEAQDAYFNGITGEVTPAVQGVSFDIEAARELFDSANPGDTVRVSLQFTQPEVTSQEISDLLYKDLLASMDTTLGSSTANRITNVTLAAAAINGYIMKPGDEFSFNEVVGRRTSEKGYKPAGAYAAGKHVDAIGGGICQVSSTLYYCTLKSDMEITYRRNHGLTVAYLPLSLDATVSWPDLDFRFVNNKNYPIRIAAWVEDKTLYVELWGTRETENTVELESVIIETNRPQEVEVIDPSLAPGERVVEDSGQTGYVSEAYKIIKDKDGTVLSRTLISRDTYRVVNKTVRVGAEPQPEPQEPEKPEEPTQPAGPTQPETPPEVEEPGETEDPGTTEEPGEPEPPAEPEEPVGTEDPGETEQPGESEEPGTTEEPGEPENPGETEEPGEPEDPGTTEDTGETEDPGESEDPGTTEEPGEDEGSVPVAG